ncbi:MAG: glycosyltransferase family 2 protein [Patescibacteria group bacterium]
MKVAAIIPALNEEQNIANVIRPLRQSRLVNEIIVIDDGSTDRTARVAQSAGARVITHQNNCGKGIAMFAGANATDADILFFADADLMHFIPQHADALIEPVKNGEVGMTVGLRDRGRFLTWLLPHIAPVLGGERAIRRVDFLKLSGNSVRDFGIETAMNAYCRKHHIAVRYSVLQGLRQVVKERKYGFWKGFRARIRMFWQIIRAEIETLWK